MPTNATSVRTMVVGSFATILVAGALQAFALFGIPFSWLGLSLVFPFAYITYRYFGVTTDTTAVKLVAALFTWLLAATAFSVLSGRSHELGASAQTSTPFATFVFLRFYALVAFGLFLYAVNQLFHKGMAGHVLNVTMGIGVAICLYALYAYFAQLQGLPEFERNRPQAHGMDGERIVFSYAFHRAMGSFLEPSTLAAFLIVPFFCSIASRRRLIGHASAVMMLTTIFLTGSLTGLLSIPIGLFLAAGVLLIKQRSVRPLLGILVRLAAITLLAFLAFKLLVHPYVVNTSFEAAPQAESPRDARNAELSFIGTRISRIATSGVQQTNRAYVYEALLAHPPPLMGFGFGLAYLELGDMLGKRSTVVSFLNLYLNILYSGGVIALAALLIFLAFPLFCVLRHLPDGRQTDLFYAMAAYFAWLATYFSLYDELNLMSAIPYAMLLFLTTHPQRAAQSHVEA